MIRKMNPCLPEGCAKLKPADEDVVVLLPKTDPCPNPELWPNDVDVLDPNNPAPVLLGVLALLEPKENDERAALAVGAPKRLPPPTAVVLLVLAPNADWLKEKLLAVPPLLLLLPKLLAWPNAGLPKPVPEVAPNPDEPNTVEDGAAGAEDAGGAAGCPNTVLVAAAVEAAAEVAAVAVVAATAVVVATAAAAAVWLLATVVVTVVATGAAVLMTGVTFRELLSVVGGGGGCVNMEPGFSEVSS